MGLKTRIEKLQEVIGYQFKNSDLLERSLCHRSFSYRPSNERLEFLGDRVLGLVITEYLYINFQDENEGQLSKKMNFWVCKKACARAARKIDLGSYITMSSHEDEGGGRNNSAILGDACEALLAAIYLDGGLDPVRKLILYLWEEILGDEDIIVDPKSELQEWAQGKGYGLPEYALLEKQGPDHAPNFTVKVTIKGHGKATAEGKSHKRAQNAAALKFLNKIKKNQASKQLKREQVSQEPKE